MIYFLIPVYNEAVNIEGLKKEFSITLPDKEKFFVFVDDCSTDNSVNTIHQHFKNMNYHIIEKEVNKGPGDSFNLGFEWILTNTTNESEIIVTIEGDNTSDLSILSDLISISSLGFDLVLASVYAQGGKLEKTTFLRKVLSFFANIIMRLTLNLNVFTLSSFYRVYKISIIQRIKNKHKTIITENGFLSKVEILIKAVQVGASIIEVPTKLLSHKRKGKSKMSIYRTLRDYLRLILNSRRYYK